MAKAKTAATVQKVYIGPSIPRHNLRNGMILRGTEQEIEDHTAAFIEKYPEVRHLIVNVDALPEAQAKVRTKGNILNKYYLDMAAKAASSRRGGGDYA